MSARGGVAWLRGSYRNENAREARRRPGVSAAER